MSKCSEFEIKNNTETSFGSTHDGKICGTTDAHKSVIGDFSKFTNFFIKQGGDKDKDGKGNNNDDQWMQQCLDHSNQGATFGSNDTYQYLGLCDGSELTKTKFVRKGKIGRQPEKGDEGTLSVCEENCGEVEGGSMVDSTAALTKEQETSGKEVKFYLEKKKSPEQGPTA